MPQINVTERNFAELHDEVWNALLEADEDLLDELKPRAYGDRQQPKVKWPSASEMTLALARSIDFVKTTKDGEKDTSPPSAIVRSVLEAWKDTHKQTAIEAVRAYYTPKSNYGGIE